MNPDSMYESDLLDAFAITAMQELLRDDLTKPLEKQMGYEWVGKWSYIIANQMMKSRNENNATKTA